MARTVFVDVVLEAFKECVDQACKLKRGDDESFTNKAVSTLSFGFLGRGVPFSESEIKDLQEFPPTLQGLPFNDDDKNNIDLIQDALLNKSIQMSDKRETHGVCRQGSLTTAIDLFSSRIKKFFLEYSKKIPFYFNLTNSEIPLTVFVFYALSYFAKHELNPPDSTSAKTEKAVRLTKSKKDKLFSEFLLCLTELGLSPNKSWSEQVKELPAQDAAKSTVASHVISIIKDNLFLCAQAGLEIPVTLSVFEALHLAQFTAFSFKMIPSEGQLADYMCKALTKIDVTRLKQVALEVMKQSPELQERMKVLNL